MPPRNRTITAKRETVTEEVTIAEHAPGPLLPADAWARLTAPLACYQVPVVITDAERAAGDAYRDQLRAGRADDRTAVDGWHATARQAVFGPLDDWLGQAPRPVMLP